MTWPNAVELADRLFLRGFSGVGQAFGRKSRALRQEDERLRRDPAHAAWKNSTLRKLKLVFLGGGAVLTAASLLVLMLV